MLVLSRKENEKVLFPHLGIALQILRAGGGKGGSDARRPPRNPPGPASLAASPP